MTANMIITLTGAIIASPVIIVVVYHWALG